MSKDKSLRPLKSFLSLSFITVLSDSAVFLCVAQQQRQAFCPAPMEIMVELQEMETVTRTTKRGFNLLRDLNCLAAGLLFCCLYVNEWS